MIFGLRWFWVTISCRLSSDSKGELWWGRRSCGQHERMAGRLTDIRREHRTFRAVTASDKGHTSYRKS